jgi:hypothetical protein
VPHHGALKNHNENFWTRQNSSKNHPYAIFSVGTNHYKHPSEKVIASFDKKGYKIHSTNKVGGFMNYSKEEADLSYLLDMSSVVITPEIKKSELNGDQCFVINEGRITYQYV